MYETVAEQSFKSLLCVIFDGQLIIGVVTSGTVEIVTEAFSVHPISSVITTSYVPAVKPEMFWFVEVKLVPVQSKEYGVVPPLTTKEAEPSAAPIQVSLLVTTVFVEIGP